MNLPARFHPIGTPGQPWGVAEKAQWRAQQRRQRSYADDVLARVDALRDRLEGALMAALPELRHLGLQRFQLRLALQCLGSGVGGSVRCCGRNCGIGPAATWSSASICGPGTPARFRLFRGDRTCGQMERTTTGGIG